MQFCLVLFNKQLGICGQDFMFIILSVFDVCHANNWILTFTQGVYSYTRSAYIALQLLMEQGSKTEIFISGN